MHEEEQRYCGYEHCQRPLETKSGHRRKEYCNDKCRQAAHRLRVEQEQASKKASFDYYLTKYHSPRLRNILERTLKEQGASDLLRLAVAIDEEISQVQGSDAMGERVTYLQMQLSEYRKVVDLDDREKIGQQFLAVGQLLGYRALDTYHIGEGIEHWKDYQSWTYETTLAEVIIAARAIVDEELEARERVKEKSHLRQIKRELIDTRRELAKYLPPPRTLLECTLRRWCALTKLPFQGKTLAGEELDAFLRELSERRLLAFIETGEQCYFAEKHHQRRIAIIQQYLHETEPYRGDPALSLVSMDDQGTVTFASGDRDQMDMEAIKQFWARIVGKRGQRSIGTTHVAAIQHYLCTHPGECVEIPRGTKMARIVVLDDDAMAATETLQAIRLNEQDIEQASRWAHQQI